MPGTRYIKNVFILAFLIAVFIPFVNYYFILPSFTHFLVEATENEAIRVSTHLSSMILTNDSELNKTNVSRFFNTDKAGAFVKDFNLLDIKVFSPEGHVLYSTKPHEAGRDSVHPYFSRLTAAGRPLTKIRQGKQSIEGERAPMEVVETFIPVIFKGKFAGAVEIYNDITTMNRALSNAGLRSSVIPLFIILVFLGLIITTMVRADRDINDIQVDTLPKMYRSPFYSLMLIAGSIFTAETIIMFVIHSFPFLNLVQEAVFDSTLLVIILSPTLYFFLLRPLLSHISRRKTAESLVNRMAYYDELTGLPNRSMFSETLNKAIVHADRYGNSMAVLFLDIDDFKRINDTLEHRFGDLLLKKVAERLTRYVRETDTIARNEQDGSDVNMVARLGGDEFSVLLTDFNTYEDAARVAQRLLNAISLPFQLGEHEIFITTSIGIGIYPQDGYNADAIIKNTDTALYHAKFRGKNSFQFYEKRMNASSMKRLTLESELQKAIKREEFLLHYQPQIDLKKGKMIGAEALIRWNHPEKGLILPGEFINVTEETGLIIPIGEWVLRTVCWQSRIWQNTGIPPLRISVNLSSMQFLNSDLLQIVSSVLSEYAMDPRHLELEITESILMHNRGITINVLNEFKQMGIRLSIDDFGTGYSSLGYLKQFPLDSLKIDRSFVSEVPGNEDDAAIVSAIIAMSHRLNLTVIAEGFETMQQLDFLRQMGCDEIQGFLISRPLSTEDATYFIAGKSEVPLS